MSKAKIALKLLKHKKGRQLAVRALKNEQVRKIIVNQVARRAFK